MNIPVPSGKLTYPRENACLEDDFLFELVLFSGDIREFSVQQESLTESRILFGGMICAMV